MLRIAKHLSAQPRRSSQLTAHNLTAQGKARTPEGYSLNPVNSTRTMQFSFAKGVLKICMMFLIVLVAYEGYGQCGYSASFTTHNETCHDFNDAYICCSPSPGPPSNYTCTISPVAGTQVGHCFYGLAPSIAYTVTVMDILTNCSVSHTSTPVANDYPDIIITQGSQVSCGNNGQACAYVAGGSASITVNWYTDAGLTNFIASGTCISTLAPGTYYYNVIDSTPDVPNEECVNSGYIVVAGSPAFTFLGQTVGVPCTAVCSGQIQLDLTGVLLPATVSWTGPTSGTANNVNTNDYNIINACQGTYIVTVTDANGCTSTQNFIIGVSTNDVIINSCANPIWNSAFFNGLTDVTMSGNVIVMPGACLQIQNMTIRFKAGKYMLVNSGATLEATNTVFDVGCGDITWQGVQALGITGKCDALASRAKVELVGCTITHAIIGFANNVYNNNAQGGRITATNCWWTDNKRDIHLTNFSAPSNNTNNYGALFTGCTFRMLTNYNPPQFFDVDRLVLGDINDVRFDACNITNALPAIYGDNVIRGLSSGNSHFQWIGNNNSTISGLSRGIVSIGFFSNPTCTTGNWNVIDVTTTQFNCIVGVFISGAIQTNVIQNHFSDDPAGFAANTVPHVGVQIQQGGTAPSLLLVADNIFQYNNLVPFITGTLINNCKGMGNYILRNDYTNCDWAIETWNRNRAGMGSQGTDGLHIECNIFNTCGGDVNVKCTNTANCNTNATGIASNQADTYGPLATGNNSAGNRFVNSTLNASNVVENDIQAINTTQPFTYHYHPNDVAPTQLDANGPTEMSRLPDQIGYDYDIVTVQNSPDSWFTTQYCLNVTYPIPSLPIIQGNLQSAKQDYDNLREIYIALVDGGNTEELLDNVMYAEYAESWQLYQDLLSQSPALSSEVMMTAVKQDSALPNSLLTLVLAANPSAAKNPELMQALYEKQNPLSAYQLSLIEQGKNSTSLKELLESDLGLYRARMDQALAQAFRYYAANEVADPLAELAAYLDADAIYEHRLLLAQLNMTMGNSAEGATMMQDIAEYFKLSADVDQQLTTWSQLLILHHLVANRVDVTFTSSEIAYLESVMMNDPCGNGAYAMSLLYTFAGYAMHEATACPELRRAELQSSTSEQEVTSKVYPNPVALGSATIQTQFAVNEITSITILDYMGRNVMEMQLPANMQELPFNAELLAAGVYMIHIRNSVTDEYFNFVKQ